MKQCLLAMKDMRDNNGVGEVFGFVTTGKSWKMLRYDGRSFQMSEEMLIIFNTIGSDRQRWMDSYSIAVECIFFLIFSSKYCQCIGRSTVIYTNLQIQTKEINSSSLKTITKGRSCGGFLHGSRPALKGGERLTNFICYIYFQGINEGVVVEGLRIHSEGDVEDHKLLIEV